MLRAKKVAVVTEVAVRPQPTPRDPVTRVTVDSPSVAGRPLKARRAVKIRRAAPIRAYIGPNGHGKSLAAVMDLMPSLDAGRPVLSTVPLLDWRATPDELVYGHDRDVGGYVHRESGARWQRPEHPCYVRLTEWAQIMDFEAGDVFLDEVAGVASSRQSSGMPAAIERLLQKLRKSDITLSWTAPAWARADLVIRETTQAVTVSRGTRPERHEHEGRLWRRNRAFDWTTYDANAYTDWTEGKRDKAIRLCGQRFWGPGSDVFDAYDSLGAVDTITSVTDAGRCVQCGGTRRAPACSCAEYVERVEAGSRRRGAPRSGEATPRAGLPGPPARHRHGEPIGAAR